MGELFQKIEKSFKALPIFFIRDTFKSFIEAISFERKLSDHQMECMQFGICEYSPKQVKEVPFFHY